MRIAREEFLDTKRSSLLFLLPQEDVKRTLGQQQ